MIVEDWIAINVTAPQIAITVPNGGETLAQGQAYNITWTSKVLPNVDTKLILVDYSQTKPVVTPIATVSSSWANSYAWKVPANLVGNKFKVAIMYDNRVNNGGYVEDLSDDYFSITTPVVVNIVKDDFNSYANGTIMGQGGWNSYVNGNNFVAQGDTFFDGTKAIYNNTQADSVITKSGTLLTDGKQAVYVRTENRANWGLYPDGNTQVRVSKGVWASGAPSLPFAAVSFKSNGNVAFYDSVNDVYKNFTTYNDNEWTLLEIEWRSSDRTARYKVNNGAWTDWYTFQNASSFTNFDNVGLAFDLPSGTGGVYFDMLR